MQENLEIEASPEAGRELKGMLQFYSELETEGGIWAFQDEKFIVDGLPSNEGLYFLHNGDRLTILDKKDPEKTLWQGVIDLEPPTEEEELFIHNNQSGVDKEKWREWFIEANPARLQFGEESVKILEKARSSKAS